MIFGIDRTALIKSKLVLYKDTEESALYVRRWFSKCFAAGLQKYKVLVALMKSLCNFSEPLTQRFWGEKAIRKLL